MSEALRARIYDLYAAYGKGQLDFVLDSFDANAEFISCAPINLFPYLGRQQGKAAIESTMKKAHAQFEHVRYQPIFLVVEEDSAAIIIMARLHECSSSRNITLLVAHFVRFRDGRVVELREFMDTFDAVQQILGREIQLSKA